MANWPPDWNNRTRSPVGLGESRAMAYAYQPTRALWHVRYAPTGTDFAYAPTRVDSRDVWLCLCGCVLLSAYAPATRCLVLTYSLRHARVYCYQHTHVLSDSLTDLAKHATSLRAYYAMSGTDAAYVVLPASELGIRHEIWDLQVLSAYARAMRCPVLT
eukprot:3941981-Rhodomonas_salina.10